MASRVLRAFLVALVLCLAGSEGLAAGLSSPSTSATEGPSFRPEQIIAFAKKVERTIAARGARVALVSRVGVPPAEMPPGMHFSHVGFAVYSQITTAQGAKVPGYAMYNLYQSDEHPDRSSLVQDYPADFFAAVVALEAGVIIPSEALQRRLLDVITSPTYAALHNPRYSTIANPFTLELQNCTEFVLDVLMAAIYRTGDIGRIKAAERAYFVPHPVEVDPIKLLFGSMFMPGIAMSDHPGAPVTATYERIVDFIRKYDAGSDSLVVVPDR